MEKKIFLVGTAFMLLALIGCANASAHIYGDTWSITKTTQLTNNTACDGLPVWSDFGTGLFYASNESATSMFGLGMQIAQTKFKSQMNWQASSRCSLCLIISYTSRNNLAAVTSGLQTLFGPQVHPMLRR